jgi:hypothetical protein
MNTLRFLATMALEEKLRIEWIDPKTKWEEKPNTLYGIWMNDTSYEEILSYIGNVPSDHRKKIVVAGWLRPLTEGQHQRLRTLGVGKYDISYGRSSDDTNIPQRHDVEGRLLDYYSKNSRLP